MAISAAWLLIGGPRAGFAGHMAVHVTNIAVAAPLLAMALAPRFARLSRIFPWMSAPLVASFVEFVVLWGWHTPQLHALAREAPWAFLLEQAMFLTVSFLLWAPAFAALLSDDRRSMGASVVALLFTSMHMTLLGALIVFAPHELFSGVPAAANICGLSGEEDQVVGATMMLIAGATVYLAGGLRLVAALLSEKREDDAGALSR